MNGSQHKGKFLTAVGFIKCPKDGKMYNKQWGIVSIKLTHSIAYGTPRINAAFTRALQ